MKIQTKFSSYIVFSEETILSALNKMNAGRIPFIFTVADGGELQGVVTGGDLRRWLTSTPNIDLSASIARVANRNVKYARADSPPERINAMFTEAVTVIPMVDQHHRIVSVALAGQPELRIAGRVISDEAPTYIIAEIGNNHQGDPAMARQLVDICVTAGADCAKFQMRNMATLYRGGSKSSKASEDLGSQYTLDLLERFNLPADELLRLFDYCIARGITPLCTPWDEESVDVLDRWGMDAFKVASADMTNHPLLRHMASKGRTLVVSTGMSSEVEIRDSAELLRGTGVGFALLHCNSTYPAPYKDVNLGYLARLKTLSGAVVGYSGHERGYHVPIAAVALGARIIEKHVTLDRGLEGADHRVSLLPHELAAMVQNIRDVEDTLGRNTERTQSQGERINRETLAKSIVAARPIAAGQLIERTMIAITSPGKGLQPNRLDELVGSVARRDMSAGEFFFPSDLDHSTAEPRPYRLSRPWGVPVRYHDFRQMAAKSNPDLLEYHLSYKDMELEVRSFFNEPLPISYVVHAPELFAGDHVLDLCSDSPTYRQRSIDELKRVVDVADALRPWHRAPKRVLIVTNVGGFSESRAIPAVERPRLYDRVAESLARVDTADCEIIPQTMPPFPWHFGGQRFHNLFIEAHEIAAFCNTHDMRVCLDVSHSKLACNHLRTSFSELLRLVGPHTAHLHMADALGIDGEGLQIGDGDMDFVALARDLEVYAPTASMIPEVWQGHKNGGEGFWLALERLEGAFAAVKAAR
jgi:N-acetylneuraminate synthase